MLCLAEAYHKSIHEELSLTEEEKKIRHVGKQDPKRHLEQSVDQALKNNISQNILTLINAQAM